MFDQTKPLYLTNQNSLYFCVNQWLYMYDINSCSLVQQPSTITILYMIIDERWCSASIVLGLIVVKCASESVIRSVSLNSQ